MAVFPGAAAHPSDRAARLAARPTPPPQPLAMLLALALVLVPVLVPALALAMLLVLALALATLHPLVVLPAMPAPRVWLHPRGPLCLPPHPLACESPRLLVRTAHGLCSRRLHACKFKLGFFCAVTTLFVWVPGEAALPLLPRSAARSGAVCVSGVSATSVTSMVSKEVQQVVSMVLPQQAMSAHLMCLAMATPMVSASSGG